MTAYDNLTKAASGGGSSAAEISAPKRPGRKRKLSSPMDEPPLAEQLIEKVFP